MFQAVGLNAMLSKQIVREVLDKSIMSSKEEIMAMSWCGGRQILGHEHVLFS